MLPFIPAPPFVPSPASPVDDGLEASQSVPFNALLAAPFVTSLPYDTVLSSPPPLRPATHERLIMSNSPTAIPCVITAEFIWFRSFKFSQMLSIPEDQVVHQLPGRVIAAAVFPHGLFCG